MVGLERSREKQGGFARGPGSGAPKLGLLGGFVHSRYFEGPTFPVCWNLRWFPATKDTSGVGCGGLRGKWVRLGCSDSVGSDYRSVLVGECEESEIPGNFREVVGRQYRASEPTPKQPAQIGALAGVALRGTRSGAGGTLGACSAASRCDPPEADGFLEGLWARCGGGVRWTDQLARCSLARETEGALCSGRSPASEGFRCRIGWRDSGAGIKVGSGRARRPEAWKHLPLVSIVLHDGPTQSL